MSGLVAGGESVMTGFVSGISGLVTYVYVLEDKFCLVFQLNIFTENQSKRFKSQERWVYLKELVLVWWAWQ